MSGSYSGRSGSGLWVVIAFLLGMALLAAIVAIAVAMGMLRVGDGAADADASPSPTFVAVASPAAEATDEAPTAAPATAAPGTALPASPGAGATPGGVHVVQSGESLFSISQLYGVPIPLIVEANQLENPDRINVGQELIIPVPASPTSGASVHYVQPGESISSIALLYDVTPTELADANGIENWDLIYVGQALTIPGAEGAASPAPSPSPEE